MPIESYLKAVNEVMKDRDYLYDSMNKGFVLSWFGS